MVITRETLCRFARQLDVDVLKFYIPKDIPRYLMQPCPEDSVFRPLMVRLCAGTDNSYGETGPENPFLTFALVSAFCEQDIFFPFPEDMPETKYGRPGGYGDKPECE